MSDFYFSNRSKKNMKGVDERLILITREALKISPFDFGIPENGGLRTPDQQLQLYLQKLSKLDGYKKISKHQKGKALDFYVYKKGMNPYSKHGLSVVAAAHLQVASKLGISLEWGGLWGWDYAHVQLAD